MTGFIETYPFIAALLVAVISWLAIASELFILEQKILAIGTSIMGTLGIFASFGGAQKAGNLSMAGVAITLVAFLVATAWVWTKWSSGQEK